MAMTPNLDLPQIAAAQAQKHVTHNEALARLDALVQLAVVSRALAAPPALPVEGMRCLVPEAATGGFAGQAGRIAQFDAGVWRFLAPRAGWQAFVEDEALALVHDGAGWRPLAGALGALDGLSGLGIGTASDATNRLAVRSPAALFTARRAGDGGSGDMRLAVEKEQAADTASLLFQTGFSGRAEFGLAGDDDFHIKVSPDGANWLEALRIDRTNGVVSFSQGVGAFGAGNVAAAVNLGIACSVAGGALIVSLTDAGGATPTPASPALLPFRAAAAADGTSQLRAVAATTSLVISAGSTLGTAPGVAFALWIVAFDDAGTVRLGAINCRSGGDVMSLAGQGLAPALAEGGAGGADATQQLYAEVALTASAYVPVARLAWENGLAIAGNWSAGPTRIDVHRPGCPLPGQVLQRRSMVATTQTTTSSTAFVGTALSLAVTPTSAASLFEICWVAPISAAPAGQVAIASIFRNATDLGAAALTSNVLATASGQAFDAPGASGPITYQLRLRVSDTAATAALPATAAGITQGMLAVSEIQC